MPRKHRRRGRACLLKGGLAEPKWSKQIVSCYAALCSSLGFANIFIGCYVLFRRDGRKVDMDEARSHLLQFGDVNKLEFLHEEAVQTMRLPGAVFAEYKHFDPSRDIISVYP
jgi:hypothetical protein